MSLTSRPREATSVATSIRVCPSLKSSRACSRSHCSLFYNHKKKCHKWDFNKKKKDRTICKTCFVKYFQFPHEYWYMYIQDSCCLFPFWHTSMSLTLICFVFWPWLLVTNLHTCTLFWLLFPLESMWPWIPSANVCLVPNFVIICTVVLDEQSFKCCHCIFTILHYLILEKRCDP